MSLSRVMLFLGTIGLLSGQISGPVAGYLFHSPTKSIRPVFGVPGGAVLAHPIASDLRFGSVSPDGRWALVVRADAAAFLKLGIASAPEQQKPAGLISEIDVAAWASNGQAVVLGSSSGKRIQTVRLNGSRWQIETPRDLSLLPGNLSTLAVDSSAAQIAIGMNDAAQGGLYLAGKAAPALLMSAPLPVVAAFAPRGSTLYAAGSAAGVIDVFEGTSRARSLLFAPEGGKLPEVTALAPSADGKRLLATAKDIRKLWSFDLQSAQPATRLLESAPATLQPLAGRSWFLQTSTDKKSGPITFVTDSVSLTTSFVPVAEADRSSL